MLSPIPEDKLDAIKELIFQGRKIEAIKAFRASAGTDLKDAKEGVESLEKELRTTAPESFNKEKDRRGCLGLLVAFFVLAGGFAIWLIRTY